MKAIVILAIVLLPVSFLYGQSLTEQEQERQQAALALLEKGLAAYEEGNYSEAAAYYVESIQKWATHQAAANLCNLYLYGQGVEKNYELALELCEAAETMNNPHALVMLGEIYLFGRGVQSDRSKAIEYYRRGAESGHVHGQYILGLLLAEDNDPDAEVWLSKAAEQGHSDAGAMLMSLKASEIRE